MNENPIHYGTNFPCQNKKYSDIWLLPAEIAVRVWLVKHYLEFLKVFNLGQIDVAISMRSISMTSEVTFKVKVQGQT